MYYTISFQNRTKYMSFFHDFNFFFSLLLPYYYIHIDQSTELYSLDAFQHKIVYLLTTTDRKVKKDTDNRWEKRGWDNLVLIILIMAGYSLFLWMYSIFSSIFRNVANLYVVEFINWRKWTHNNRNIKYNEIVVVIFKVTW